MRVVRIELRNPLANFSIMLFRSLNLCTFLGGKFFTGKDSLATSQRNSQGRKSDEKESKRKQSNVDAYNTAKPSVKYQPKR